jgi:mono/diheme cytochrome c family protein
MRLAELLMAAGLALALAAAHGCGRQARGAPHGPPVRPDTVAEARGEQLFHRHCYPCHPGGEAGLGPAINDKPLPELAIELQIRKGVGAMPAFSDQVLSDDEVDAIAKYVKHLRQAPATYAGRK